MKSPNTPDENPDLTSTIHLSALRSVRNQRNIEEIFTQLSPEERSVLAGLPKDSAMLVVLAGPNRGERFLLNEDLTTIGRDSKAEIFFNDVTVSRTHAVIKRVADGFVIEDKGSLNGTYVNSHQVASERLLVGDEVQIGKYRLTYFSGKGNS